MVSAGVGCAGGGRKNGADDVLSVRKRENGRDRGNQRTVLRGAEFRLQEEGARAGALGAAAVWEVKRGERIRRNRCDKMINSWRSELVLKRELFLTAFFVTKSSMQNPFGAGIPEGIAEYYFLHLPAPAACAFFLLPSAHST